MKAFNGVMKPVETWKNQLGILEDGGPYLLVHLLVSATLLPSFVCPQFTCNQSMIIMIKLEILKLSQRIYNF